MPKTNQQDGDLQRDQEVLRRRQILRPEDGVWLGRRRGALPFLGDQLGRARTQRPAPGEFVDRGRCRHPRFPGNVRLNPPGDRV